MQIGLLVAPVPQRQHDVALDALRPRRLRLRRFAGGDAIGPRRPFGNGAVGPQARRHADHLSHRLPGLQAAHPGVTRIGEVLAELMRDRARARRAERMAGHAAERFDVGEPVVLVALSGIDAVAGRAGAGEFALGRNPQHRIPVDRRIVLRRRFLVRRDHGGEVELPSGLGVDLRRVDEAVAAHPHLVFRLRQIRDDVTALVVGDDDLGVFGRQVGGLRDHPHAGLRSLRPGHDAADVVIVDGDRRRLRHRPRRHTHHERAGDNGGRAQHQCLFQSHVVSLPRVLVVSL